MGLHAAECSFLAQWNEQIADIASMSEASDPMCDTGWLYKPPSHPNAVQWSEDNLIAVCTGSGVTIVSPSNLNGPRGYLSIRRNAEALTAMNVKPDKPNASLYVKLACVERITGAKPLYGGVAAPAVRAVAWSPTGCSTAGGCLIAVLSEDGQVGT